MLYYNSSIIYKLYTTIMHAKGNITLIFHRVRAVTFSAVWKYLYLP